MKIGDFFRKIREGKRWPQEKVAERASINQPYLSVLEKLNRMPNFDVACRICDALNITPTDLWINIKDEYVRKKEVLEEGDVNQPANG
ncbi:hypothetical protein LCGC14_2249590 [marine sediment metagenome]|uniref:HTH cro/C1-type domain-containing protein n=1 Tax=marine sediment metagenome TaxID=412755 RepID=A0A0F9FXZ6_9ZZZZ